MTSIQVTGPSSFSENFFIETQNNSQIIANGLRSFAFVIGQSFQLVLTDAQGASAFTINFTLQNDAVTTAKILDGAVTASKLNSMGASNGQFLKFQGGA